MTEPTAPEPAPDPEPAPAPPAAPGPTWVTRLRTIGRDGLETFFIGPVRSNVVRSRGGGATAIGSLAVGVIAFAVAGAGVVLGPRLAGINTADGLGGAMLSSTPGKPLVLPGFFVPTLFVLLTVGCSLALFGAVLARPIVAAAATVFVALTGGLPAAFAARSASESWTAWIGVVALALAVVAVLVMRRWRPPLPVVQLVTVLGAAGTFMPTYLTVIQRVHANLGSVGQTFLYSLVDAILGNVNLLIQPMIFFVGVTVIGFGITVTAYLRRSVLQLGRSWAPLLLIVVVTLLILRLVLTAGTIDRRVQHSGAGGAMAAFAVTTVTLAAAVLWWRWAADGAGDPEKGSVGGRIPVVTVIVGPVLVLTVTIFGGFILTTLTSSLGLGHWLSSAAGWMHTSGVVDLYRWVTDAGLLVWAVWRAGRAPGALPGWVGLVGALDLARLTCSEIAPDWAVLSPVELNQVVVVLVAAAAVRQLARRRLPDEDRTASAGALLVLAGLAAQGSFLTSPFAPILGFTGIGFVLFGVVWGFLTSGGHGQARGLRGLGRSLIMLGYAIVPTALLALTQAEHAGSLTAAAASTTGSDGQAYLGDPLLLAVIAAWLPVVLGIRSGRPRRPAVPPVIAPGEPVASAG